MQIGVNTLLWTAAFTEAHFPLIAKAKALGLDGIELATFDFASFPAAAARRALEAEQMPGILCSALVAGMSLATDDTELRARALEFLRTGVRATAEAGMDLFIGPFCSAVGYLPGRRRTEEEWKRCVDGLQRLGETAQECGVRVAVEPLNRFETFFLNTAADARRLAEEVAHPNIGILYDTFHANIEEKNQAAAIRLLGKHIFHVHTCENDRGIPGTGPIDWPGVMGALREIGYDDWLVIESFGPGIKEIAAAACIWRDLSATPEEIPALGARNLRTLL
ncbi:MAG TPA: sugar phosphate isomerase/epimerase family protein [Bryobacteraceae bacterium]|nr:sugar phosphate isomerase/epimerase family protein [Bryobacteraceae bacterium]